MLKKDIMTKEIKKLIRDGKVAVLFSPGYGAGWSTWNDDPSYMFNYNISSAIDKGLSKQEVLEVIKQEYGEDGYYGGAKDLMIEWINEGVDFNINEYDGSESIEYLDDMTWNVA